MSLINFFAHLADRWSLSFTAAIRKPPLLCLRFATCFPSCQRFHKCRKSMEKSVLVPFDCKIRSDQCNQSLLFLFWWISLLPTSLPCYRDSEKEKKWLEPFLLVGPVWFFGGERGQVVGCWICNPEVPVSNPPPCHEMDLSLGAPYSTPPGCVNS